MGDIEHPLHFIILKSRRYKQMKNLIKKCDDLIRFKAHAFECGDNYTLEINGEKYPVALEYCGPVGKYDGNHMPIYESRMIHFTRVLINESGVIRQGRIYPGQEICGEKYVPGVNINISIPVEHFVDGKVKIYHGDELINPNDVIISSENWMIDASKINLGSIWNLTIDGDPRFQNTMIMIIRAYGSCIEFAYQTRVVYSPEYSHIEAAEGRLMFDYRYMHKDGTTNINDYVDKIHLTLVKDNTNNGADMDRSNDDIVYPRSYGVGSYREDYPPVEFRKRMKRNPDEDEDYDPYDEV